jgi:replicative DNA helicase
LQDGSEPTDFEQVINEVEELGEARYLISKLYAMTVNKCITAAQQQQEKKNAELHLVQVNYPQLFINRQIICNDFD